MYRLTPCVITGLPAKVGGVTCDNVLLVAHTNIVISRFDSNQESVQSYFNLILIHDSKPQISNFTFYPNPVPNDFACFSHVI
jgi:hypothetical protein